MVGLVLTALDNLETEQRLKSQSSYLTEEVLKLLLLKSTDSLLGPTN
jgi:hypothetical protein